MHEFSIVSELLEQCECIASKHAANRVISVRVRIGARSGVDARLLKSAFGEFRAGGACAGAELVIDCEPVVLSCAACGKDSEIASLNYTHCPCCGGCDVEIIGGKDMILERLEME